MPYPWRYIPLTDFAAAVARGEEFDARKLALELANIAESINQLRTFITAGFNADTSWQPLEATAQTLVEQLEYTATAGQTEFEFPSGTVADTATDHARVFAGGTLVAPSSVTLATDAVTIPAQSAGTNVVVELFNDADSVRTDLASTAAGLGAALCGIEDALGRFTADNVEDALAESAGDIEALTSSLAAISNAILSDGSVDFAANQSMGGYRLTDLANGTDTSDAVTVAQLNDLTSVLGNLGNSFLAISGGVMAGSINMSLNKIINVPAPVNDGDAANKEYVDGLADDRLHLTGTKKSTAEGSITGPVTFGNSTDVDADSDQTGGGAPADVNVHTIYGVPNPAADDQVVNKRTLDDEIARLSALIGDSGDGVSLGSCELLGAVTDISDGGVFHASSVVVGSAITLDNDTWVYAADSVTVNAAVTGGAHDLTIEVDGSVAINAAISAANITIIAAGNITYNAALTATESISLRSTNGNVTAGTSATLTAGTGESISVTADTGSVTLGDSADVTARSGVIGIESAGDMSIANCDVSARGIDGADLAITSGGEDPPLGGNGANGGGLGGDRTTSENLLQGAERPELAPLVQGMDGQDGYYGGFGGRGGEKGTRGGIVRVTCRGDGNFSGSRFWAIGGTGGNADPSANAHAGSGAGGGSVRIVVFGSHTGGTLDATGGVAGTGDDPSGGGAGGLAVLVAPAPDGGTSVTAAGRAGNSGGSAGGNGTASLSTLTAAKLQCLDNRGVWDV